MKIVNRKTFLGMPAGTVFAKFSPHIFGDLCIKGESIGDIDFFYQQIVDAIAARDSGEEVDILDAALEEGAELEFDFYCETRDGLYEQDQLFAVWSAKDVRTLIGRLEKTVRQ